VNAIEALAFMRETGLSVVSFTKDSFMCKERFSLHDDEELAIWNFGSDDPMVPDSYIEIVVWLQAYDTNVFVPIDPDRVRNPDPWLES
jgi:hypothetical protein